MKRNFYKTLILGAIFATSATGNAADRTFDLETADGLYYNILSAEDKTVAVDSCKKEITGELTIPSTVTINNECYKVVRIGERGLQKVDFSKINLPETITSFGYLSFSSSKIESIVIPGSVTEIERNAFQMCDNLRSVTIEEGPTYLGEMMFIFCGNLEEISLPNTITEAKGYVFYGCSSLKSFTFPENMSNTGQGLLYLCSGLTEVKMNKTLPAIQYETFAGCKALESVEIPASVTSIGANGFRDCAGLKSIVIPEGVTEIGKWAFMYDYALETVKINGPLTTMDYAIFKDCVALKEVNIPETVTKIDEYAFWNCNALPEITIPDNVVLINGLSFPLCTSLSKISFGKSLNSIGSQAFYGCSGLTEVTCHSVVPPTMSSPTFDCDSRYMDADIVYKNSTLYVPEGSKDAYANAEGWKKFTKVESIDKNGVDAFTSEETEVSVENGVLIVRGEKAVYTEVYDINGRSIYSGYDNTIALPARGIYLVKAGKIVRKVAF